MAKQDKTPRRIIKCPHCGYNYLPSEIFYIDNVLGFPANIIRDPLGVIIYEDYQEGKEPIWEEHFYCDNCKKPFMINMNISFVSSPEPEERDFSDTEVKLF